MPSTAPPITSLTSHHTAPRPGLSCAHHLPCPFCPRCPPLYPPLSLVCEKSSPFSAPLFLLCTSPLLSWSSPSCALLLLEAFRSVAPSFSFLNTAVQMASLTPEAEAPGGALHAAGDDVVAANLLAAAVATEGPVFDMPDFKMGGKKNDDAAPTDAGDGDGDDDDGDEDGDFGEGEEDVSEGEGYDNPKGIDNNKKRAEPEENGEEDEEEPEGQEGGGGDDDDDDDDDNEDDDDDDGGEDDDEGVDEEEEDQDNEDDEEDDDEDSLQPPKKRKK